MTKPRYFLTFFDVLTCGPVHVLQCYLRKQNRKQTGLVLEGGSGPIFARMKDSRRRAISTFERIEQRIGRLAKCIYFLTQRIPGWEYREGRHRAPGRYDVQEEWKPYTRR